MICRSCQFQLLGLVSCALIATGAPLRAAAFNTWSTHGPYGGMISSLAVHPTSPDVVYAGMATGLFKSTDGGATWALTLDGTGRVLTIVFAPSDPNTMYAGTEMNVFRSTDAGDHWDAAPVVDDILVSGFANDALAVAVDPADPDVVYDATNSGIWKTTDGGQNWLQFHVFNATSPFMSALAIAGNTGTTMYAATRDDGGFKSTDGGVTWFSTDRNAFRFVIDPTSPSTIYAIEGIVRLGDVPGISKSTDDGLHWIRILSGYAATLAIDTGAPSTLYASANGGILKSTDGGANWALGLSDLAIPASAIAVAPTSSNIVYAGTAGGVLKSSDAGITWTATNYGLEGMRVGAVVPDLTNPGVVYAVANNGPGNDTIFKSTDGGDTWSPANQGISAATAFAMDPATPSTLYTAAESETTAGVFKSTDGAATWSWASNGFDVGQGLIGSVESLAVAPLSPTTLYAGTDVGNVFGSIDAGQSWQQVLSPFPPSGGSSRWSNVRMAIAPTAPPTVYAITNGVGVFRTTDGGANWSAVNRGLFSGAIASIAIDSMMPTTLYVGAIDGGLYKSRDGGDSWFLAQPSLMEVYELAAHPIQSDTLYAVSSFAVFKSTDGAANWTPLSSLEAITAALSLGIDAAGTVYAGTGRGVFKSTGEVDLQIDSVTVRKSRALSSVTKTLVAATTRTARLAAKVGGSEADKLRAALLAGVVSIELVSYRGTRATLSLTGCAAIRDAVKCQSADGRVAARLAPRPEFSTRRVSFRVSAKGLGATIPAGPVRVILHEGATARVDMVSRCRFSRGILRCRRRRL